MTGMAMKAKNYYKGDDWCSEKMEVDCCGSVRFILLPTIEEWV
jgi:hypothetical protein